jgi:hypothetical protein
MTITTEDGDRQNVFAKEPKIYIDPSYDPTMTFNERAELLNGRIAMISVILAMISYFTTGTLAFGLF